MSYEGDQRFADLSTPSNEFFRCQLIKHGFIANDLNCSDKYDKHFFQKRYTTEVAAGKILSVDNQKKQAAVKIYYSFDFEALPNSRLRVKASSVRQPYMFKLSDDIEASRANEYIKKSLPLELVYHFHILDKGDPKYDANQTSSLQLELIIDRAMVMQKGLFYGGEIIAEYIKPENFNYAKIKEERVNAANKESLQVALLGIQLFNTTLNPSIIDELKQKGLTVIASDGEQVSFDSSKVVSGTSILSFHALPTKELAYVDYTFPVAGNADKVFNHLEASLSKKYGYSTKAYSSAISWKKGWISITLEKFNDGKVIKLGYSIEPYYAKWKMLKNEKMQTLKQAGENKMLEAF